MDGKESGVHGTGVVVLDPVNYSPAQHLPGNMLSVMCSASGQTGVLSIFVTYPFDDLPRELRSGMLQGSLTNGEVERAMLGLPDSTIAMVSQSWFLPPEINEGSLIGLQPTNSTTSESSFGIRTETSARDIREFWDTRVIEPDDDDFGLALDRAAATATRVEEVAGPFR